MYSRLSRAISIADFILEDDGHSSKEAAEEFRLSQHSINREIAYLGNIAYSRGNVGLQKKYLKAIETLKSVHKKNHVSKRAASI